LNQLRLIQPRLIQPKRGWDPALIQPAIQLQKMIDSTAFQWPKHFRRYGGVRGF